MYTSQRSIVTHSRATVGNLVVAWQRAHDAEFNRTVEYNATASHDVVERKLCAKDLCLV